MSACKHIQNFNSVRKGLFDFLSTIQEDSELVDLYPSIFDCATMMTLSSIFLFVGLCKIKTCDLHIYQQGIKLKGYPTKIFNSVNSITSFTSRTIKISLICTQIIMQIEEIHTIHQLFTSVKCKRYKKLHVSLSPI